MVTSSNAVEFTGTVGISTVLAAFGNMALENDSTKIIPEVLSGADFLFKIGGVLD